MFFLLYRHTDDSVFDDFSKISCHFPKIYQKCSEGQTNIPEHFPKISEDCRRLSRNFEEDPKMFNTNQQIYSMYNLRDILDITEIIDIFTGEDMENMPLKSWM